MKKKTKEQFIEEAKLIHGNKYDYSLVDYKNNNTKVNIICNKCKRIFKQLPRSHISNKSGCSYCYGNLLKTKEQFIEEAKLIHGNKYDYSLADYINAKTSVKIICKKCKRVFFQTPDDHLHNHGCSCFRRQTTEQFIEKAKLIHGDKYDYSLVDYVNVKTPIKIVCKKCGNMFEQIPNSHLNGKGCKRCRISKGEEIIENILKQKGIKFESQKKYKDLKDINNLSYDFYIPSKNLLIEYNGIQHYKKGTFNKSYKDFLLQKHHDWLKRRYAKNNNIDLLTISYKDGIINKIEEVLNENN